MNAASRIAVRITEAEACIQAIAENNHARLILSARRGALQDALADIQADDETRRRSLALLDGLTQYGPTPGNLTATHPTIVKGWDHPPEDAGDPADGADPEPDPEVAEDDDDTSSGEAPVAPGEPSAGDSGSHPAPAHRGAPTPPPDPHESPIYTAARLARIRELWPDPEQTLATIWAAANAIPAEFLIASPGALKQKTRKMGLPDRRGVARAATEAATERLRAVAPRPPVPLPPAPRRAPEPPPATRTPEQQHAAAKALLREGYDATVIATRTGLPEDTVRALESLAEDHARTLLRQGGMSTEDIGQAAGLPPGTIRTLRLEIQQQGSAAA